MKLELRLSLALTTVTAVALGASCLAVYLLAVQSETRNLDESMYAEARAAAAVVQAQSSNEASLAGIAERSAIGVVTVPVHVAVYGENGALVSASPHFTHPPRSLQQIGPDILDRAIDLPIGPDAAGHSLRGVTIPIGNSADRLLLAVSKKRIDSDMRSLSQILGVIYLSVISGTALVARWLGRRLAGDVRAIAAVARDVSRGDLDARVGGSVLGSEETQALASDLDHMIAKLSALVFAQRTFISFAAHELRSPLTAIRGELQLALRHPRDNEGYQRALVGVLGDVEALVHLAEDLLTLARIQAVVTRGSGVAAGELVAEAARMARGLAEARGVEIRFAALTAGVTSSAVTGTHGDVSRALRNLIDNAVSHSPEGGVVEVNVDAQRDLVRFVVTDSGPGVDPVDAPNLFAPFFRGARASGGEMGGAGLGLAIARDIARAAGGDVVHDSEHGPGARFRLELPRAAGTSARTGAAQEPA